MFLNKFSKDDQTPNSLVYSSYTLPSLRPKWWDRSFDRHLIALGSYLTYLTYGQNFVYHLGNSSSKYANRDEFLMTSSFVNVDQNLGGLYSAIAPTNVQDSFGEQPIQQNYVNDQKNWPMPFDY